MKIKICQGNTAAKIFLTGAQREKWSRAEFGSYEDHKGGLESGTIPQGQALDHVYCDLNDHAKTFLLLDASNMDRLCSSVYLSLLGDYDPAMCERIKEAIYHSLMRMTGIDYKERSKALVKMNDFRLAHAINSLL